MKTLKAKDIHAQEMAEDAAYREADDALAGEFALVDALLQARRRAELSQAEAADPTGTHPRAALLPRKRPREAVDPHARALCRSHRAPAAHQSRAAAAPGRRPTRLTCRRRGT